MLTRRQRGSGRQRDCWGGVPQGASCPGELWQVPLEQAPPCTHVSTGKLLAMLHCHAGLSCPKLSCARLSCAELALMVLVPGGTILCWAKLSKARPGHAVTS